MIRKILYAALFALSLATPVFAAQEDPVQVTIRGVLYEDKHGYFIQAEGTTFDLVFDEASKADMHKFYSGLNGDKVKISGALRVEDVPNGKPRLVVYANDAARFKNDVVVERREVVVEPPPVVIREHYVEPRHGIHLPGIHINW